MNIAKKDWLSWLCLALLFFSASASAQDTPAKQVLYQKEQLDQMLAPVALYPDSLLAQLLMASTYPSDIAEAAEWSKANPSLKGEAATKAVESKNWDPSVKGLASVPQVLAQLKDKPDWVQKLGDAFLAQPDDVMASVQRLRAAAQKAGALKTTEQQKVVVEQEPTTNTTVIQIEPTNPEVVYVPSYNPTTVYGTWAYPSYPPYYCPPPYGYYYPPGAGLVAFGVGVAVGAAIWGNCNWGGGNVNINVNRYNNINTNNRISGNGNQNWNHNASNRRGTPYADNRSRSQYGQGVGGSQQRGDYRGRNSANDASRQRAQQSFNNSTGFNGGNNAGRGSNAGNAGNAGRGTGGSASAGNRASGGQMNSGMSSSKLSSSASGNAFSGAKTPQNTSAQQSRGQSSRQTSSRSSGSGSGAGRQVSRSSPQRSSGGGRRR